MASFYPYSAVSLGGPLPFCLCLSNMAKEDNSKLEAEERLEKVLVHFHLLSGTSATAMRIYPAEDL